MDCPSSYKKRSVFGDRTNEPDLKRHACDRSYSSTHDRGNCSNFDACMFYPDFPDVATNATDGEVGDCQTVHPSLPKYFPSEGGVKMSHDDLAKLLSSEDDTVLLDFLAEHGVIADRQECCNCGDQMRRWYDKSGKQWYWICTKQKDGKKCKNFKFSVKCGTFLRDAKLSTQNVMWVVWHFVHGLTEQQCKQYTNMGQKNNMTVVHWYRLCRQVCDAWIRKNFEPLGGFGKVVEIDESFLPGNPKYGKGHKNDRGKAVWVEQDEEVWAFGLIERGRPDPWLQRVRTRGRKTLVEIINDRCNIGTIFMSDKWRAYHDLEEYLIKEDCLHYTVNHKKDFVDPVTGAHTQTIEGNWNLMKASFPSYGV